MTLLYVDTSALFKRYVEENESEAVLARIEEAPAVGTALITRVEVAAALAQAVRQRRMARNEAQEAEREFLDHWDDHHVERLAEDHRHASLLASGLAAIERALDTVREIACAPGD